MSFPNQRIVTIASRVERNKENLYAMINLDALQEAVTTLKGSALKMWLYFNKNQDNYTFEFSPASCLRYGIKSDSCTNGANNASTRPSAR